ncbi:amino acid adenylation domain-containing protein [Actinocorallia sp. API 0066]|uniref:non-ribosomal peptide synthetase n=1 Tax=Actinocorallia sp. API 0066 TaxID=2896846 RepID=UPI001E28296E|nr:non-ribosomal peptide synthetase [Actinocorallia sp. API 0066]MCD0447746.1 amino acid adenylation domain-containing protein [Actinocorallia sp. API 0066]
MTELRTTPGVPDTGRPAVVSRTETLTHAELDARVDKLAHDLARRITPGQWIAVDGTPSVAAVVATLAVLRLGAIPVPRDLDRVAEFTPLPEEAAAGEGWDDLAARIPPDARGAWAARSAPPAWTAFLTAGAELHVADSAALATPARLRDWLLGRRITHAVVDGPLDGVHWPAHVTAPELIVPRTEDPDRFEPFPLTDTQQAYWIGRGDAVELGGVGCHGYWEWEGDGLDVPRFTAAWRDVVDRHDALRTVILPDGTQRVLKDPPAYEIPVLDLRELPDEEAAARAEALREELAHRIIPADRFPLWDVRVTLLPHGRVRLHLGLDLLIIDAWSYFQILVPDLVARYADPGRELPPLSLRFRTYALEMEEWRRTSAEYAAARAYWLDRIDDLPPAPQLPRAAGPLPEQPRFTRREFTQPPDRWSVFKARAAALSVTPSGLLLAAFAEVLRTWSADEALTINVPLFDRAPVHPDVERVIGDFTTTSLLAVTETGGAFADRARAVQRRLWADLEHRHFSGVQVMRELATRQGVASRAAFPIVATILLGQPPRHFHTALGEAIHTSTQTPQVTLDMQVAEVDGALRLSWDSVDEVFPPGLLADMFGAFTGLLDLLVDDGSALAREVFDLVPSAQVALVREVNSTAGPHPDWLLHAPVAAYAAAQPDAVAVVSGDVRLSYAELDGRVNRVGRVLRETGAEPGRLVAVVMRKGWEQIVAAHGVLASGAAYLPIDPAVPAERLRHLLADGEVSVVLTQSVLYDGLAWPPGVRVLCVDVDFEDVDPSPLTPVQGPSDLAYVIYTSGSTGVPKGVMVEHRGAANTIADVNARFGIGPGDSCLAVSDLHFDLSVYDVFGMIAAGGTVVVPEHSANPDPERWAELLTAERVTFWNSVPALLELLVGQLEGTPDGLPALRTVILAGDWIPVDLPGRLRALAPDVRVIASGGPTETCVWSVINPLDAPVDPSLPSIPYGRPMTNQRYHVVDSRGRTRPVWVPGEMHVASEVGLARGYWRDPERTAAKFVPLPGLEPRAYATGDLGRLLPDGSLEILGRTDFQVKLQGHRIELGEIESALTTHPSVARAVVLAAGQRLIAFVTGENPDPEALRTHLSDHLPAHMIPATIGVLDALPLTRNGKVDRLALADLAAAAGPARDPGGPPQGPVEEVVALLWGEFLGIDGIGRTDHFFGLGGNSLVATRTVTRLRELFGVELPLRVVFARPTVADVAAALVADPADAARVHAMCEVLRGLED